MPLQPYTGSCHCGLITFTAHLDLSSSSPTAMKTGKCNCTICLKTRAWEITIPPANFTLSPSSAEHLTDYTFGTHQVHHLFCKVCGVRAFGRGDWPEWLGEFVSVNVVCLEGVGDEVLAELAGKGRCVLRNGREGRWGEEPGVSEYL